MKTNNKWTVKDVITTVLLTVLLIGIHFVVITVSMVNQFFNCVLSPGVSMFFSAPVYMLMVSRVNKRFVSLTYLTILGVFFLLTGNLFRFGRPTMRLMATIRSRCCAYSLAPVAEEVCAAYLKKHFPKEPEAARYAALFGGKIGSAKRCLEDAAGRTLLLDALKLAGLAEKQDVYGALALLSKYEKDRAGTQALLGLLLNVCSASLRGSEAAQSPVSPARAARCAGEAGKTARLLAGNVSGKLALTCLAARLTA